MILNLKISPKRLSSSNPPIAEKGILLSSLSGEIYSIFFFFKLFFKGFIIFIPTSFHRDCASLREFYEEVMASEIRESISEAKPKSMLTTSLFGKRINA